MIDTIRFSSGAIAVMLVAAAWLSGPAAAQTSNAEALRKAMQRCAAIADAEARHICSDAVLQGAGMLEPDETEAARRDTPQQPTAPETAQEMAEPEVTEQAATHRPAGDLSPAERDEFFPRKKSKEEIDEEVNEIEVTLRAVRELGSGKFLLTDTEGVVWQQLYTRTSHIPPREGQSMTVRKNALNGYMCRVERTPSFRCKPVS